MNIQAQADAGVRYRALHVDNSSDGCLPGLGRAFSCAASKCWFRCGFPLMRGKLRLYQPHPLQAGMPAFADDDVVVH